MMHGFASGGVPLKRVVIWRCVKFISDGDIAYKDQ